MNGVTHSLLQVIAHLRRRGDDVLVVAPTSSWLEDTAPATVEGYPVYRLPSIPLRGYPNVRVAAGTVARIRRVLAGFRPDVVHVASPFILGWRAVQAAPVGTPGEALRAGLRRLLLSGAGLLLFTLATIGASAAFAWPPGVQELVVSATLFLSNPEEYDGGELAVEDTYGVHSIKLPAGHMILYPATSLHHVTPVTRGVRTSSFFWIQSMVRDDGQRTLLFDLDSAIQRVAGEIPESEAPVQLTAVYHNLLRRWAEM